MLPWCTCLARSLVAHAEEGSRALGTCVALAVGQLLDGPAGWSSRWMPVLFAKNILKFVGIQVAPTNVTVEFMVPTFAALFILIVSEYTFHIRTWKDPSSQVSL